MQIIVAECLQQKKVNITFFSISRRELNGKNIQMLTFIKDVCLLKVTFSPNWYCTLTHNKLHAYVVKITKQLLPITN
jgi:hypothetical protein